MPVMPPARSRSALSAVFFLNGVVLASWVPHIPSVKTAHGLSDGALGVVLLCMSLGAVFALPLAGWFTGRVGSHRSTTLAAVGLGLALPLPIVSPSAPLLGLSLMLLGACNGLLDVSMNAQAVAIEARYERPIMSSFHGFFGLGGFAGAALAGASMWLGIDGVRHVVGVAVLSVLVVTATRRWLLTAPSGRPEGGIVFARPSPALAGLGFLAFCALLVEGSMGDWSAVYLRDVLGTSPAVASAGFAGFSLTMAAGRFAGDRLVARLGPHALLRGLNAVAAGGLAIALLTGQPAAAVAGFGLVGLGISNAIPVFFSAAARVARVPPGIGLAAVATTGYLGFLAGPPLIGLVAEVSGLAAALAIVAALCGVIAVCVKSILPVSEAPAGESLAAR